VADIERFQASARMSQVVVHQGVAYVAGQVADEPTPSVGDQTKQVLDKIERMLVLAGTDKSRILSANVWLSDIGRFAEMNEVWDAWVSPGNSPARATVQAALARPGRVVEIAAIAAV
jgi:enamine deaminase RidA (YjgF/YER057c/UK114 family)